MTKGDKVVFKSRFSGVLAQATIDSVRQSGAWVRIWNTRKLLLARAEEIIEQPSAELWEQAGQ